MPLFKKILFLSLVLLIQSGVGIFGTAVALDTRYAGEIQQGVAVNGVPVGGLTLTEAAQKLESSLPTPLEKTLDIQDADKSYQIPLSDIDGKYDYLSTAKEALRYGNKGKIINQLMSILRLRAEPTDFSVKIAFSEEKLAQRIKSLQGEWEASPKEAEVKKSNDKVEIIPEKTGYSLDFEKTLEQVRWSLAGGNTHVTAVGKVLEPNITSSDLEGINTVLAEYITTFNSGAINRSHNIALASAAVNGSLLKPGEVFSLNQRLGPRLAENGYLKAPVFIGDSLGLDFGGGVCQVATTLYNAVLLTDLSVVERYSHPLPVDYVAPGRDATIAGDYLDLKFANNRDTPVYISSLVEAGTLTIRIFGVEKETGRTIKITSEKTVVEPKIVIVNDNTLSEGETQVENPGQPGYRVRVYREVVVDGRVESKKLISNDYYKPEDKVIHVGPKPIGVAK